MADFLFLFRGGAAQQNQSPEEMQATTKKWTTWIGGIAQKGVLKGGQPLEKGGKVINARRALVDGPYVETKDFVGGYLIVSAKDLPEAVDLAKGCPATDEGGSVEVRAIAPMPS